MRTKLEQRAYTSVSAFSSDMAHVITSEIGVQPAEDTAELQMQISGRAPELSLEQRDKRKLAKRIIGAVQPALEDALRKESDLSRRPFERELKDLDSMFEYSDLTRRESGGGDGNEEEGSHAMGKRPEESNSGGTEGHDDSPVTLPVRSENDEQLPLAQGGIQWYMQPFDPEGTTIHEERWTGRDVMRGISEELSELDDEELQGLQGLVDEEEDEQEKKEDEEEEDEQEENEDEEEKENGAEESPAPSPHKTAKTPPKAPEPVRVHMTRRKLRGGR